MKTIAIYVLVLLTYVPCSFAAITCPPMPAAVTDVNRDVSTDIKASAASLGKVKAGEVAAKTEVTAKNLFEKYPNVDKIMALQTMAATYCAMLRDMSAISEKEKLDRWERYQEKVLNLQSPMPPPRPRPIKTEKIEKKSPLAIALKQNTYELGWSSGPIGTVDSSTPFSVAIEKVLFQSENFVVLQYTRTKGIGEVRATLGDRTLTGTWNDEDGSGELELAFDDSLARAVGWWNRGGQTQKFNVFMRRVR